jgi:hypothetical protein
MVVFDATMLMVLIQPDTGKPIDSKTGEPVTHVRERIAGFVSQADKARTKIGIPTPALSEVLVRAGSAAVKMVEKIKEFSVFEILPFDELSAIEVAMLTRTALDSGNKRGGSSEVWSKVKYDRQIAAIAKVREATAIYTDDAGLRNVATALNIEVISVADMPLPAETAQGVLPLKTVDELANEPTLEEIEEARDAETSNTAPS